jgi:hypothetical protein
LLLSCRGQGSEFGVDPSGHQLLFKGKPFFWLADTVWLLAQMPSREEWEVYLAAREKQGFSLGSSSTTPTLSARWINPATGDERQVENFAGDQTKVTVPTGWRDALLYLRK